MSKEMRRIMNLLEAEVDRYSLPQSYQDLLMDMATEYIAWKHNDIGFDLHNEAYLEYWEEIQQAIANLGLSEAVVGKLWSDRGFRLIDKLLAKLGSAPMPRMGFDDLSPEEMSPEEYQAYLADIEDEGGV